MAELEPGSGTRLTAVEIHENILESGDKEIERPAAALLWSALASGLVIGFSFLAAALASDLHALGFRHSIAGSVEAFYLAGQGLAPWGTMLGEFVVPSVIGNAIGGVLLVALLNYGQVAPEKRTTPRPLVR